MKKVNIIFILIILNICSLYSIPVYYFGQQGCDSCIKTEKYLEKIENRYDIDFNKYDVQKLLDNIDSIEKIGGEEILFQPVVLIGSEILQGYDEINTEIVSEIKNYDKDHFKQILGEKDKFRSNKLNLFVVSLSGFIDGINPCAFATIIFLILFLMSIKKKTHEIFNITVLFASGVFISYFLMGLGLRKILMNIYQIHNIKYLFNKIFAGLLFILAILSLYDLYNIKKNNKYLLKLPKNFKNKINKLIRNQSKSKYIYFTSIITGFLISIIELACTGQIYLPMIHYIIKKGSVSGYIYLVIYNLFFISPLIIIGFLVFKGMKKEKLQNIFKKNLHISKLIMAVFFIIMGSILFFY